MASKELNRTSTPSRFHIHVAGLPSRITADEIWKYFSGFGQVQAVKTIPSQSPGKVKGYCMVRMEDEESYQAILDEKKHRILGSGIICVPYQSGNQLMRENRVNNQKRIVVRGIPPGLYLHQIKSFFDQKFGNVQSVVEEKVVFEWQEASDDPRLPGNSELVHHRATPTHEYGSDPNHKIYSVMFTDKESAKILLDMRHTEGEWYGNAYWKCRLYFAAYKVKKDKQRGKKKKVSKKKLNGELYDENQFGSLGSLDAEKAVCTSDTSYKYSEEHKELRFKMQLSKPTSRDYFSISIMDVTDISQEVHNLNPKVCQSEWLIYQAWGHASHSNVRFNVQSDNKSE